MASRTDARVGEKRVTRILRWEQLPPTCLGEKQSGGRPRGSHWDHVAQELREESGRWAVVYEGRRTRSISIISQVRRATVACFAPAGAFEARMRTFAGVTSVYVRHVG